MEKKRTNKTKIPVAYGSTKKSIILQRTKHLHRNRCAFEELVGDIDVGGHAAEEVQPESDPDALYAHLVRNYPEAEYHSVYEAGFCGFWIHYRLVGLGIHNIVVNPADVPTTTSEKLRKTDAVDSAKLARSLRAGELKGIYVPGSESLETRSLIRLRDSITKDQTRLKNRIKSHLRYLGIEIPEEFSGPGRCWNRRFVVWLKGAETGTAYGRQTLDFLVRQYESLRGQRLEMLRAVMALSRTERFEKPLENLMTVPGIGQLTGMSLLSEIDDIRRFKSADQLAAFIGMIPMCHSSGEREGVGDITVRRSARLRSVLVEASWVAVRQDPALSMAYGNYCKRMAPGKAIIKIARKLVNRIYFVMKRNQPYVKCVVA